jgi:hypothetical protein
LFFSSRDFNLIEKQRKYTNQPKDRDKTTNNSYKTYDIVRNLIDLNY